MHDAALHTTRRRSDSGIDACSDRGQSGYSPRGKPESAGFADGDRLVVRGTKGRGTDWRLQSRFESLRREPVDDGWGTPGLLAPEDAVSDEAPLLRTQVIDEQARRIVTFNDSPDIGFDHSINPYRGCEHGCVYCYARPTHGWLGLSPGLDFETRIVAKRNAAERLRATLTSPGYTPRLLNIGSATDAYQPIERRLRITRAVIEVLTEHRHAFSIVTKSAGVVRDIDLIASMAAERLAAVYVSITTLDPALARALEPRASSPSRRLQAVSRLAEAGVPVGVHVAPLILFLNEPELERILDAAREAGARAAFATVLRLPWEVSPLFRDWLQRHVPERAARIMARVREMRGGRDNDPAFGTRMTGQGVWAQLLRQRLDKRCARLGLSRRRFELDLSQFRRSGLSGLSKQGLRAEPVQAELFPPT